MHPAVDFLADVPLPAWLRYHALRLAHLGGYMARFNRALSRPAGVAAETIAEWAHLDADEAGRRYGEALVSAAPTIEEWLGARRAAGIVHSVFLHEDPGPRLAVAPVPLPDIAEALRPYCADISFYAGVDALDANLESRIRQVVALGASGLMCSPFMSRVPPDDARFDALWAEATAHELPVWVHCSRHFWSESPPDIGHPRHLLAVAAKHRRLLLIAGHAGYPWTGELVHGARDLRNVYVDLSTFRPRQLVEDPAFAPLLAAGAAELADRVLFAGGSLGLDVAHLLDELDALPLPEGVRQSWRYGNAVRLLRIRECAGV